METFVTNMLANADLSQLSKKSVKEAYRKHIGRDLRATERREISQLINFLIQQNADILQSPKKQACAAEHSSDDRENVLPSVSKEIYESPKFSQHTTLKDSPRKPSPWKISPQKPSVKKSPGKRRKPRSPRMRFADVLSAVLDSDQNEVSEQDVEESDEAENQSESEQEEQEKTVTQSHSDDGQFGALARLKAVRYRKKHKQKKPVLKKAKHFGSKTDSNERKTDSVSSLGSDDESEDMPKFQFHKKGTSRLKKLSVIVDSDSDSETEQDLQTRVKIPKKNTPRKSKKRKAESDDVSENEFLVKRNKKRKVLSDESCDSSSVHSEDNSEFDEKHYAYTAIKERKSSESSETEKDTDTSSILPMMDTPQVKSPVVKISPNQPDSDTDSGLGVNLSVKSITPNLNKKSVRKNWKTLEYTSDSSSISGESDSESNISEKVNKQMRSFTDKRQSISSKSSDSEDDVTLSHWKKTSNQTRHIKSKTENKTNASQKQKKLKSANITTTLKEEDTFTSNKSTSRKGEKEKPNSRLANLRKICRGCGIIVRNTVELKGCDTDNQKIKRLKELLKKAGMEGNPSMAKVEEVRLRKEAAELDCANIIASDAGRGKRQVSSRHRKGQKQLKSPAVVLSPIGFKQLKGIVDSDGSDSD